MTGKQTGAPRAEHGLGYSVFSELSSNHRTKHHHVVLDNAFTSPVLCHDLYRYDIYVTARQQGSLMAMKYGDRKVVTFCIHI